MKKAIKFQFFKVREDEIRIRKHERNVYQKYAVLNGCCHTHTQ